MLVSLRTCELWAEEFLSHRPFQMRFQFRLMTSYYF